MEVGEFGFINLGFREQVIGIDELDSINCLTIVEYRIRRIWLKIYLLFTHFSPSAFWIGSMALFI